jgi:anti-sigma factor RsiW
MTCAETEILLHALLDGELDAGHARDVEAHLEGRPRCAAQFRDMCVRFRVSTSPTCRVDSAQS